MSVLQQPSQHPEAPDPRVKQSLGLVAGSREPVSSSGPGCPCPRGSKHFVKSFQNLKPWSDSSLPLYHQAEQNTIVWNVWIVDGSRVSLPH